jgi:hypothetical protein
MINGYNDLIVGLGKFVKTPLEKLSLKDIKCF